MKIQCIAAIMAYLSIAIIANAQSTTATSPEASKITVQEFLRMDNDDRTLCELSGIVIRIRNNKNGNVYLDDGTGNILIFGIIDTLSNRSFVEFDIREGDFLTVRGYRSVYDGRTIEMKNAQYVRHAESPNHYKTARYDHLDVMPTFKGMDTNAFSRWVSSKLVYPKDARKEGVQGRVMLVFTVDTDGSVVDVKVLESLYPSLDREAVRVISSSPKWSPGIVDSHPVRYTYTMPVIFQL